ncbi:MAG: radical SAM protein [Spirochaetales bacterium]|nr:radical SAM protein [Spirochaetales bacterium]
MVATVFMNTKCQLRCRYCFGWDDKDSDDKVLSAEKAELLFDALKSRGVRYLTLTGGEPLLHPEFRAIIKLAHDRGFWINILTNGLAVDAPLVDFLAGFWRLQVRVSLEGANPEIHDYFRGRGNFARAVRGMDALVSGGVQVGVGLTIYEENRDQVEPVVRLCVERGCSSLRVVPVIRIERGTGAATSVELYRGILADLVRASIEHRRDIVLKRGPSVPLEPLLARACIAGTGFIGIEHDLTLLPCSLIRFADGIPTRVFREAADLDAFADDMRAYFERIGPGGAGRCADCEFLQVCRGGCPGEKLSFGLGMADGQPVCMKDLVMSVTEEFPAEDVRPLVESWIADLSSPEESGAGGYCSRQAPFWKLSFRRSR